MIYEYTNRPCPKCGSTDFQPGTTTETLMYYPPIYENGVNTNPDRNSITESRRCLKCNHNFNVELNQHLLTEG